MKHTHTVDVETLDNMSISLVVVYEILEGCPGDYATPPDPPHIDIVDYYYEIDRPRLPPVEAPVFQLHLDCLDFEAIKDDIFEKHFPHY